MFRTWRDVQHESGMRTKADVRQRLWLMDARLLTFGPRELRIANGTEVGRGMRKRWRDQPLGQISGQPCGLPVQRHLQKYFASRLTQITSISPAAPHPTEGGCLKIESLAVISTPSFPEAPRGWRLRSAIADRRRAPE